MSTEIIWDHSYHLNFCSPFVAGLSGLVAIYTIITLVAGIVPKKYINRHTINTKKVAILDLNLEEKIQVLCLSIAGGCGLFFLGNYGVEGDFNSDAEEWFIIAVMVAGAVSLLVTAIWKGLVIRAEIKRDQEKSTGAENRGGESSGEDRENETPVYQLSSIWVGLGVVATTGEIVQVAKRRP